MEPLITASQTVLVFVAGLLARLAVLLLAVAVVAVPIFLVLETARGYLALRRRVLGLAPAGGLVWNSRAYYAPGHTWVRRVAIGSLRVGLDDLAQRVVAGTRAIELPRSGAVLHAGDVAAVVRCGDKRGEIVSPVDGTVTAVNETVTRKPSLVHSDPYARGWLFTIVPSNAHYRQLLRGGPARAWLGQEEVRLARFLERNLGLAAADGGEPILPAPSLLSAEQWRALTRAFLATGSGEAR